MGAKEMTLFLFPSKSYCTKKANGKTKSVCVLNGIVDKKRDVTVGL